MKKIIALFIFVCAFVAVSAFAQQNKVIVIPLNTSKTKTVAESGQTLRGQLNYFQQGGGTSIFGVAGASFPMPLPAGTARPTLEILSGTSVACPGIGSASSGVLCIYIYNESNFDFIQYGGSSGNDNRLYGFSVDVFFNNTTEGWLMSSWAYQVP